MFDILYNEITSQGVLVQENKYRAAVLAALLAGSPMDKLPGAEKPSIQQAQLSGYTKQQVKNIITRTLWAEARNDGEIGMRAVAAVIYNRAQGDSNRFVDVIKKPKQFSCWNGMSASDWSPKNFKMKQRDDSEWNIASAIADEMVKQVFEPVSNTYDHYYNPDKASPAWGKGESGKIIGSHKFMDLSKAWDTI